MGRFSIMGIFNDVIEGSTSQSQGPPGPPGIEGPQGNGFKLDARGNFTVDNKKITGLGYCTDRKDAASKGYVDRQFSSVNMTRNVLDCEQSLPFPQNRSRKHKHRAASESEPRGSRARGKEERKRLRWFLNNRIS